MLNFTENILTIKSLKEFFRKIGKFEKLNFSSFWKKHYSVNPCLSNVLFNVPLPIKKYIKLTS
jgi:hypothetical protein